MIQGSDISQQSFLVKCKYLETICVDGGEVQHLAYHQKRYERTLEDEESPQIFTLRELIEPPKEGRYRCRLLYGADGVCSVSYHPYKKRVTEKLKLIEADSLEYAKKYANREALDALFLQKGACDDVLIVKNGYITDTTIANVAFFDGVRWFTPREPLLHGTTRARLVEKGFLEQKDILVEDIFEYSQMALMNAMIDFDIIQNKKIEEIVC